MKKIILSLGILTLTSLVGGTAVASDGGNLTINKEVSSIEWIGKKVTGEHSGTINIKNGTVHLHDGVIVEGEVVIDMSSIVVTDLKGVGKQKLEGHLNSPDFFDVSNHGTAKLKITSSKAVDGENKYTVSGNLTIKGITKAIEFPATIEHKEGKLAAYAEVKVDRTLYDIKYGSGKFFEGLGDKMIDDNFIVKFKIAAN